MSPFTHIYAHTWLSTCMYTYMHRYTIYVYHLHNDFVSAEQKEPTPLVHGTSRMQLCAMHMHVFLCH